MEVETEKAGVNTTLDIAENNIEQLKTEISYLSKEKAEVVDSLNAVSIERRPNETLAPYSRVLENWRT